MVLAVVLATLDQLPLPEESILDSRPIMTPLAFRTFPSADCIAARKRAIRRPKINMPTNGCRVPSLVEVLLHRIRESPKSMGSRHYNEALEDRHLLHLLHQNSPFYHHYNVELEDERSRRGRPNLGPRLMHLTTATLIVVPPNLIAQWNSEILKHCHSGLRALSMRSKTEMPQAKAFASDYDVSSPTLSSINITHIPHRLF